MDSRYNPYALDGKTILVTGASSGIGRQTAIECSRLGANVVITARNAEGLAGTMDLLEGCNNISICADLTDADALKNIVGDLPVLDGVVHNAGAGGRAMCRAIDRGAIDRIMDVNFTGTAILQRHLLKMKKIANNASIVIVSSVSAHVPSKGNAVYAASKAALIAYAKTLALELAPKGIRVNCVLPSMVMTEMLAREAEQLEVDYSPINDRFPLGRMGRPEDIAGTIAFLLGNAASWITGSEFVVDGGHLLLSL